MTILDLLIKFLRAETAELNRMAEELETCAENLRRGRPLIAAGKGRQA